MATTGVTFGAMADPIHKQLSLPKTACVHVQKMADALTLLSVGGVLSDTAVHGGRKRLMKRLAVIATREGKT